MGVKQFLQILKICKKNARQGLKKPSQVTALSLIEKKDLNNLLEGSTNTMTEILIYYHNTTALLDQ